jgi:integrase
MGYRRGVRVGKWVARYRKPGAAGGYAKTTLGEADDVLDADGERVFDWRQAQEHARLWFDQQARGGSKPGPFTVGDALDEYIAKFRGKSLEKTRNRIDVIIRPALGGLSVYHLTRKVIADCHRARAESPEKIRTGRSAIEPNVRPIDSDEAVRRRRSTANRDLTVLKAALNRAADDRPDLPVNAWRGVKPYGKVDGAKLRYLSETEARKLVEAVDEAFRPLVQAALLTGARYGELTATCASDFDADAAVLWLRETKSNVARPVYLDGEGAAFFAGLVCGQPAEAFIFRRPDGKRWGASQQARPLILGCKAAGVNPASFHDLRRTYGARLALKGVPMAVIAQALGHADERITRKHYAHLSPSYLAETIRAGVAGFGIA